MSVQFGRWNFDGAPEGPDDLRKIVHLLSRYAPDGVTVETAGPLTLLFGAFHTTNESKRERQPLSRPNGSRIMWDGRLDNREECGSQLTLNIKELTDLEIVSEAWERWGPDCFARLIGDWAISVWSPSARSLVLTKDFLGARHLYYSIESRRVTWSTILDPLVLLAKDSPQVSEEYVAGWLSGHRTASITPYKGILAVPPASLVTIYQGKTSISRYWQFIPRSQNRSCTDRQYADRFLAEFRRSVTRRLRADRPVLAELSGGMDSSSIVCVADTLGSQANLPRLDTVSYYDDAEPNWDERPYFTRVEQQRGRTGKHIDAGMIDPPALLADHGIFLATPSSFAYESRFRAQFAEHVSSGDYRVLLSGIGGDEVTGGVPTPLPELADLLWQLKFGKLGKQLFAWALAKKKPALNLLLHAAAGFLPSWRRTGTRSWVHPEFAKRYHDILAGSLRRFKIFGPLPSFQANLFALEVLRNQLECAPLPSRPCYEKRYPFLDRDFLSFCYSIPRAQMIRPLQRRSLLRRAMAGIVPDEILRRKSKAFVSRQLAITVSGLGRAVEESGRNLLAAELGIIEPALFAQALRQAADDRQIEAIPLLRALALERWLRSLASLKPPDVACNLSLAPLPHVQKASAVQFLGPRTNQAERR